MGPLLIPLIAAAGGLVSSGINAYSSYRQMKKTNAANMAMWHKQNEYNAPSAQMQRLKDAGLNPNLVYGSGTVAGNQSGPAPRFDMHHDVPQLSMEGLVPQLGAYADLQLKAAQTDNIEAQTENVRQRTTNENIREYLLQLERMRGGVGLERDTFELEKSRGLFPYELEVQKGEARKVDAVVEQEFQRLMNMRREELERMLNAMRSESTLKMMTVEQEQKEADLLFAKYRNQWMAAGVTTSDNPLLRMFVRSMADPEKGGSIKEALENFISKYRPKNLQNKY